MSSGVIAPSDLTVLGGVVLFSVENASNQSGLWTTNGTAGGTQELTGIVGAATGFNPFDFTVFNGKALFNGVDTAGNLGLWTTDGTVAGTKELTGIAGVRATGGLDPTDIALFVSVI